MNEYEDKGPTPHPPIGLQDAACQLAQAEVAVPKELFQEILRLIDACDQTAPA